MSLSALALIAPLLVGADFGPLPEHRAIYGHDEPLERLVWSPDGARLAVTERRGRVRVLDAETGRLLHTLTGPKGDGPSEGVAFSPDSKKLVAAFRLWDSKPRTKGAVRILDLASGAVRRSAGPHLDGARLGGAAWCRAGIVVGSFEHGAPLLMQPDLRAARVLGEDRDVGIHARVACLGDRLAMTRHHAVEVWDLAGTPQRRHLLEAKDPHCGNGVVDVALVGSRLAALSNMGTLWLWDAQSGQSLAINHSIASQATELSFSPDGSLLAAGAALYSVPALDLIDPGGSEAISRFSPDGRTLAAIDGLLVTRQDVADRRSRRWPIGAARDPQDLDVSADGRLMACADGGSIVVWDLVARKGLRRFHAQVLGLHTVRFSPDGTSIAATGARGAVRVFDLEGRRRHTFWTPGRAGEAGLRWTPDGKSLLVGGSNHAWLLDAATGQKRREWGTYKPSKDDFDGSLEGLAIHPSGRLAALGGRARRHVVSLDGTGPGVGLRPMKGYGAAMAFSPDGGLLAVATSIDFFVRGWPEAGAERLPPEGGEWPGHLVFGPKSKRLLSGSHRGDVVMWDVGERGLREAWRKKAPWHVRGLAWDERGGRAWTVGPDLRASAWRLKDGAAVAGLPAGAGRRVTGLAWSPDGASVLAGGGDGTVREWDVASGTPRWERTIPRAYDVEVVGYAGSNRVVLPGTRLHRFGPDGTPLAPPKGEPTEEFWAAPGPLTGRWGVVVNRNEGWIGRYDLRTGRMTRHLKHAEIGTPWVALAEGGEALVVAREWSDEDGRNPRVDLEIWALRTGKRRKKARLAGRGVKLVAVREGRVLIAIDAPEDAPHVFWWSLTGRARPVAIPGITPYSMPSALDPSGRVLAMREGTHIRLVDTASGRTLRWLVGHRGRVDAVAFSADGARLVSGDFYGMVRVWDVATGRATRAMLARAGGGHATWAKAPGKPTSQPAP